MLPIDLMQHPRTKKNEDLNHQEQICWFLNSRVF